MPGKTSCRRGSRGPRSLNVHFFHRPVVYSKEGICNPEQEYIIDAYAMSRIPRSSRWPRLRGETMRTPKTILITILIAALSLASAGCFGRPKATDTFSPSKGILDSGFFEGIKALDYVDLCEYAGIPVPREIYEVPEESIKAELESILYAFITTKQVTDRAVVDGDTVNIDYIGRVDAVAFDGGSTNGQGTYVTIGITNYVDDFLEQLIGHTPGESFDVEVTFPEDYFNEEVQGKDAVFAVTLNYIVENVYPELTDEFVKDNLSDIYGWQTVTEMNTDIETWLRNTAMSEFVREYIVENSVVSDVPEKVLEHQRGLLVFYYQRYADAYGMTLEAFLAEYVGIATVNELLVTAAEEIKEAAEFYLIIQAIAEDAGISVSAGDVTDYFGVEQYTEYVESYGMPYLTMVVLGQEVIEYLIDNAVVQR